MHQGVYLCETMCTGLTASKRPCKRVGERGEGKFEPITWDEAYAIIAEKLNAVKAQYGASSVAFFSGYCKWYRADSAPFCPCVRQRELRQQMTAPALHPRSIA